MSLYRRSILTAVASTALFASPLYAQTATNSTETPYFQANGLSDGSDAAQAAQANGPEDVAVGPNARANSADLSAATAVGSGASAQGGSTLAVGKQASAEDIYSSAVGAEARAAQGGQAFGAGSKATGYVSAAVGRDAQATGRAGTAMGNNAQAQQDYATAVGAATVAGTNATAVGTFASATGTNAMAAGVLTSAQGTSSTALGYGAKASQDRSVALGSGAEAIAQDCVALGSLSRCRADDEVSVGTTTDDGGQRTRRITNVRAGTSDTDVANLGQLRQTAQALGGGATFVNGNFVAPTINLSSGNTYSNTTDAILEIDGRVRTIEQNTGGGSGTPGSGGGSKVKAGANVAVSDNPDGTQTASVSDNVQLSDTGSVSVGATTVNAQGVSIEGGASVTIAGVNAGNQRVTNVSAGRIQQGSTDAVNGGQLWDAQQAWNDRWTDTDRRLRHQDRRINGLGAQLGAMSQMAVSAAQNGGTAIGQVNLSAGIGFSGNAAAVSIGWSARISERTSVSAGMSFGSGNKPVAGFGVSINFGR
ncbi:YadA-like family protein [Xanthomonas graminis]|uniref:YadA-like family protein n=1 Tax=Xanthomonas graminis TaxID=3390026 RepID=UPI0009BE00A2|nr:YadA-like family protein [Xanthomonas translucens]